MHVAIQSFSEDGVSAAPHVSVDVTIIWVGNMHMYSTADSKDEGASAHALGIRDRAPRHHHDHWTCSVMCTHKNHVCEVVNRQCACIRELLHVSWKLLLNEVEALLQHNVGLPVLRYTLAPPDFTLQKGVRMNSPACV